MRGKIRPTTVESSRSSSLRAERTNETWNSRTALQLAGLLQTPADGVEAFSGLGCALARNGYIKNVFPESGILAQVDLHRRTAALGIKEILHAPKRSGHGQNVIEARVCV